MDNPEAEGVAAQQLPVGLEEEWPAALGDLDLEPRRPTEMDARAGQRSAPPAPVAYTPLPPPTTAPSNWRIRK